MIAVHTSPLEIPGSGDAGGLNVYVCQVARRLARRGIEVDIFTRATSARQPVSQALAPGVRVCHVIAGPLEPLPKDELPQQLCAFTAAVLRAEACREQGWYDVIHSHYWLSGQVGMLASRRWAVPLVHTMHTLAKVKNATLTEGDRPEPQVRVVGEAEVVAAADRLVANTEGERRQLVELYGADPEAVAVVPPGVDTAVFRPGLQERARRRLHLPEPGPVILFVGRLQPLKGPDVVIRAVAELVAKRPELRATLRLVIVGGPSGPGMDVEWLRALAAECGIAELVRFEPPVPPHRLVEFYRAATFTVVPSHSESFGLVALESQACGTPVIAARVGGLATAVQDGLSGRLIDGHDPGRYASVLAELLDDRVSYAAMRRRAVEHASLFDWERTASGLLAVYEAAVAARRRSDIASLLGSA
ncbi:MAG: D-inositol-3-phosphate glycosyltransferase [Acidothermus sp.]|nr:D-inositol-3-phosphate glycosyltransferase [Acidothermus sp.]